MQEFLRHLLIYVLFYECCALCDWMRFEVHCGKSHHRVISDGL